MDISIFYYISGTIVKVSLEFNKYHLYINNIYRSRAGDKHKNIGRIYMYAILAQSKNGVIGRDGKLPWNIPEDMLFFQRTTKHNIVIMGRKTYESLCSAAPLKNRINIVLSNSPRPAAAAADIYWANTVEEVFEITRNFPNIKQFIIGGATIYKLFENYIDYYYITFVDKEYSGDCYAPMVPPCGGEAAHTEWNKNKIIDFYSKKENCSVSIVLFWRSSCASAAAPAALAT